MEKHFRQFGNLNIPINCGDWASGRKLLVAVATKITEHIKPISTDDTEVAPAGVKATSQFASWACIHLALLKTMRPECLCLRQNRKHVVPAKDFPGKSKIHLHSWSTSSHTSWVKDELMQCRASRVTLWLLRITNDGAGFYRNTNQRF